MATDGGGRRINVREAQVHTAEVAIRTLTISGKQVTLAVFRQLLSEGLIDWSTMTFRGLPWGFVNYHADRKACEPQSEYVHAIREHGEWQRRAAHYHIVWQKGQELRQDLIWEDDFPSHCELYANLGNQITGMGRVRRGLALLQGKGRATTNVGRYDITFDKEEGVYETRTQSTYYIHHDDRVLDQLARWPMEYTPIEPRYASQHTCPPDKVDDYYVRMQQYTHRMGYEHALGAVHALVGEWTDETAKAEIERLRGVMARLEDVWKQRWAEIEALEQLFIAV